MRREVKKWDWGENLEPIKMVEKTQKYRIGICEKFDYIQERLEFDFPIYYIGSMDNNISEDGTEFFIHPPGISHDLHLWDFQNTYRPEKFELGWRLKLNGINFIWLDDSKVIFDCQCWNEYSHWQVNTQDTLGEVNFFYEIGSSDFLRHGICRGEKSKEIYYRVGSTHSGRVLILSRKTKTGIWDIELDNPLEIYKKKINYPVLIDKWRESPTFCENRESWDNWLDHLVPKLETSRDILWERWLKSGGNSFGRILSVDYNRISWTTSIRVENLLAFSEPAYEWDWTRMQRLGYGMIVGTNTAGKSSWVDVWSFGFWGKTMRCRPKGILRHGSQSGWVEITWRNTYGEEGKLRREVTRYELSNTYRMKLTLFMKEQENNIWLPYEGRHMRGETDIKSPQKQVQLDLEEWVCPFEIAKQTSLLGVDGQNEIWTRTKAEWNRTFQRFVWLSRSSEYTLVDDSSSQEEASIEADDIATFPRVRLLDFMTDWFERENLIFLDTQTANFLQTRNEIRQQLNRSLIAFQNEIKREQEKSENQEQEDADFQSLISWFRFGVLKEKVNHLQQIWNNIWGDGRIILDYNEKGLVLEWRPLGGEIGSDLGMACRWERMMIMEAWRLLVYFVYCESGHSLLGDVWLDEEWDGVDEEHGLNLMRTFGHWHGTHVIISHQEHWKRRIGQVLDMTSNAKNNISEEE